MLGSVIVVHEAGHFAAAKLTETRVSEFSIGFGPKVLQGKRPGGAVNYVLRLLPIGGFVSFPRYLNTTRFTERGLAPPVPQDGAEVLDPDDPGLLENRPAAQQAAVISAGMDGCCSYRYTTVCRGVVFPHTPCVHTCMHACVRARAGVHGWADGSASATGVVANILLAWACLFASAATVGVPSLSLASPLAVSRVLEGSRAAAAGLRSTDVLIALDGRDLLAQPDPLLAASRSISSAAAARRPFTATVERGGQRLLLPVAPPGGSGKLLGIELSTKVASRSRMRLPPPRAASTAAAEVVDGLGAVVAGLGDVAASLTGARAEKPAGLQGPLGIARMGAEIASSDASRLLDFASILSLNLAVFNTLPLPG